MLNLPDLPFPPRLPLLLGPTPLMRSRLPWAKFPLYYKRDDLTPYGLGGNKLRKLEFLLADAVEKKTDLILTNGGPQSNHARLTAIVAATQGIPAALVVSGPDPEVFDGNLLLDCLAGAEIIACGEEPLEEALERVGAEKRQSGHSPYVIPLGGSNALGATGYFLGFFELMQQTETQGLMLHSVVCAVGSAGTIAGMIAANAFLPKPVNLIGISTWHQRDYLIYQAKKLAAEVLQLLQAPRPLPEFEIVDGFVGEGYGVPTPEGLAALTETFRTDGVLLDPVYTAKSMAALRAYAQKGHWQTDQAVVFWHTGGSPAVFAKRYSEAIRGALLRVNS